MPPPPPTALFFLLLAAFSSLARAHLDSSSGGFISVAISEKGLNFAKGVLVQQAASSLVPLSLPDIEKVVRIPLIGGVDVVLSNVTITGVNVSSSTIHPGDTGVAIVASGCTVSLRMNWRYCYSSWWIPMEVSDSGGASVQVEGMEIGLTMSLENEEGSLKLTVIESGCYLSDIIITLDGGGSWFYQGFINAFEDQIRFAVEKAITTQISSGISKLNSLLQSIPKEIKVNDVVSLNVTLIDDPFLGNSSIKFDIDGLFNPYAEVKAPLVLANYPELSVSCGSSSTMVAIYLNEAVFSSASSLYYKAGLLHWIVDKVPDQSLLNTAAWKFIIPRLYLKYPNDDMVLNISLSSPPSLRITQDNIAAIILLDMLVDVLDKGQTVPVACISVDVNASGVAEISGNNLAGKVELKDFSLALKWSKIGDFHMSLIQGVIKALLNTVVLPYINSHLHKGFPLPIFHGLTAQNASIIYTDSTINVCTDVALTKDLAGLDPVIIL